MELTQLALGQRLRLAVAEDIPRGDATTFPLIDDGAESTGVITSGQALVASGLHVPEAAMELFDRDTEIERLCSSGDRLEGGSELFRITAHTRALLMAERIMLNLLMRTCGIATRTAAAVDEVPEDSPAEITDTRKTTPLWRDLEKRAVSDGGGTNHRMSLSEAPLIKENHLRASELSFAEAVERVREQNEDAPWVELEIESPDQLEEALASGADRILLDNFSADRVGGAVETRDEYCAEHQPDGEDQAWPVKLEASGGITVEDVSEYAATGVDLISMGSLTHSAPAADLSMQLE